MTEYQFLLALKSTKTFNQFDHFKQLLVIKSKNVNRLYDYFLQSNRYGLDYLKSNNNLVSSDYKLIEEITNNK